MQLMLTQEAKMQWEKLQELKLDNLRQVLRWSY